MIRTLLTTTAVALLLSAPAMAQNNAAQPATNAAPANNQTMVTTTNPELDAFLAQGYQVADTDNLASRIMGQPVYNGPGDDAEEIGEITDFVLNQNGQIGAVVIGVGGFLGMGEKNVAVNFQQLQWTIAADNTERWVLPTTAEALTAAAEFQWREDEPADTAAANQNQNTMAPGATVVQQPAPANNAANTNVTVVDPNTTTTQTQVAANPNANTTVVQQGMQGAQDTAANPNAATPGALDFNTMTPIDTGTLTAEDLEDIDVVGVDNTTIAEVSDVLLTPEGQVDALLVDFGGFLGIGQKTVAVGMDNLQFVQDQDGNRFVKVNATREQLDAAPQYDEAAYQTNRDAMRLVVTQ
jgi:sporulation protein YlmC with PRC-barrel domain